MAATLTVHVSREELHSLDPETRSFETDRPFEVDLRNHMRSVHVHLSLDGELSRVATLPENNHFVESEQTATVGIDVDPVDSPVSGRLKIVSGYGAETTYVDVTVTPHRSVDVDESLSQPTPGSDPERATTTSADGGLASLLDTAGPVWALAVVAVAIAGAAALAVQSVSVALGVVAVLLGVALAVVLLRG